MKYNELHKKLKKCGCYPTGNSIAGSGNIKKHNPNFKVVEFDHFRMQAGLPNFVLSVSEWLEKTNAVGLIVKKGRYGGTYAHKDYKLNQIAIQQMTVLENVESKHILKA